MAEDGMTGQEHCLMKVSNVCKYYGFIQALKNVSFEVSHNEIVGLIGDNGAGKSTLIKTLTGVYQPDAGELYWKGKRLTNFSVHAARDMGIVTVFQDRALSEQHSIWRNIFMGKELTGWAGFVRIRTEKEETQKLMKEMMGFTSSFVTPDTPVGNMSGGERQGVAICRALYFEADLIILDEPTGGLSLSETRKVLKFVSSIKQSGKSCIFISHNMFHVFPVADRIIILDRGEIVDTFVKGQISIENLEARLLEIAGTSDIDLKVPIGSRATAQKDGVRNGGQGS
jgi:simple sugar transport system ATP-binding protein